MDLEDWDGWMDVRGKEGRVVRCGMGGEGQKREAGGFFGGAFGGRREGRGWLAGGGCVDGCLLALGRVREEREEDCAVVLTAKRANDEGRLCFASLCLGVATQ
jgi:hypothetical protein